MSLSQFKLKFFQQVSRAKSIIITSHFSPDDDSISSSLSLYYWLTKKHPSKKVTIYISGNSSDRFKSFLNYSKIHFVSDLSTKIDQAELLICLDGGQYSRFTNDPLKIIESKIKTVCIDHHQTAADKFDLIYQKPLATSTAELVYRIIKDNITIDTDLAKLIILGIIGDTGTFNYIRPGQYSIFLIIKKLLDISQLNIQEFKSEYSLIEPESFTILQELIKNSQFFQVNNWPDFQASFLNNTYPDQLTSEASSIFVSNYLRLIKGYSWGFVVTKRSDNSYSLSFRSLPGSVDVRDLVERIGIGGGHNRAAGAKVNASNAASSQIVIKQIIDWLKTNQPLLR